ncbi:MAG: carboxypeptidase-like regulatory domain-containing protein [Bacteroidota bacterium]
MKPGIFTTVIFVFSFVHAVYSQNPTDNITITGKILEQKSNQPLAYVSIGIPDKPFGTLSDTLGNFAFHIAKENVTDTLQISLVGYFSKRIAVKDFIGSNQATISLSIRIVELAEVVVGHQKTYTETIGRQASGKFVQLSIHNKKSVTETIGSEMGMRYKTSHAGAILKDFNVNLSANNFNSIKYRINIYSVKDNMPDTLLCNRQIFMTTDPFKTGWININLEPYQVKVNKDFIVTVQWVGSRMDHKEDPVTMIPVAMSLFSKNCYVRVAALDKWQKKAMSLSNFVTLLF